MTLNAIEGRRDVGDILAIGFGTAAAMWLVGYLGRLPSVQAPGAVLFALFVVILAAGGWVAGRFSPRGLRGGAWAGAVTGAINLLIFGSLLGGRHGLGLPEKMAGAAIVWAPSCVAISAIIGFVGAWFARRRDASAPASHAWPFWFAVVATAATLILLPLGGAVTGFEAGLAVPDWPNSFGYNMFLFPLARMTGGIYYEHSHRLFGSLVGLTTLSLTIYLCFVERRRWVRGVAILSLAMVVAQGLMGAARVTEVNRTLGVIHGVFGQVFFATLALLAAWLSPAWLRDAPPTPHAAAATDRRLTVAAVAVLLVQLALGALLRHFDWGLHLHLTMAVVALVVVGAMAIRSWAIYDGVPVVPTLGVTLLWILIAQIFLGGTSLVAIWSETAGQTHPLQVLVTTAHQTTGALLLACASALAVWHRRLLQPLAPVATAAREGAPATAAR